jgi:DNA replication protein DnaC
MRSGVDTVFTTCAQLTTSLNADRANGGYERRLAAFARAPLLIIDDRPRAASYARRRRPA